MSALPRLAAGVAGLVLAVALGGCASNVYIGPSGPDPANTPLQCDQPADFPSGLLVLFAQSVPTASAVPCLRARIENWNVTRLDVRDGRALLEFSYRFGDAETVTLELARECDLRGSREVSSEQPGMQRFERELRRGGRYANERYYRYPGACTSLRFSLSGSESLAALRGAEASGALGFVSRESIDRQIRELTGGRLKLDPDPDG
jgi:hypothetical protein